MRQRASPVQLPDGLGLRWPSGVPEAQELERRHGERLALDVKHGGLDRAQRRAEHRARAPVTVTMELLHKRIRLEGIAADELALQLFQRCDDRECLPLQRSLADAVDASSV